MNCFIKIGNSFIFPNKSNLKSSCRQFILYEYIFYIVIFFCNWLIIIFFFIGKPRPKVIWYLENTVIDDSYEQRSDGLTVNSLSFPNVGRQHLNARLICQASNTNLTPPTSKVLILDVNCKYIDFYNS